MDSSNYALASTPSPRLVIASAANVEQHAPNGKSDRAISCPLNLAGHEAARQYVEALEDPNDANEREKYTDDRANDSHGDGTGSG